MTHDPCPMRSRTRGSKATKHLQELTLEIQCLLSRVTIFWFVTDPIQRSGRTMPSPVAGLITNFPEQKCDCHYSFYCFKTIQTFVK